MALPAWAQLVVLALVFVAAFAVERRVHADRRLRALPFWTRLAVTLLAMSPLLAIDRGVFPGGLVDESIVAVSVSFALWIALPLVAWRLIGEGRSEPAPACLVWE
ncbi:MAG: hypothetical protein ABEJ89_06055 [Haloarculaceae archaeon]